MQFCMMIPVYPRVCGGTAFVDLYTIREVRLSPRVRGNRWRATEDWRGRRSIPACAGEPPSPTAVNVKVRVYPRVCGGTSSMNSTAPGGIGLSPRVRGNPLRARDPGADPRSIPACAGEPWRRIPSAPISWVYPRVCGGTSVAFRDYTLDFGLSPRVRGNHVKRHCAPPCEGSIPACAGEPGTSGIWGRI